jgi:uncharacterized protein YjbI with pentapeptide repeats
MSKYTREEILKLIEENGGPEGLDLSGKDLSGIDLSRVAVTAELVKAQERVADKTPVWYSRETGGINLRQANLREAYLKGGNLREADLQEADLQGAYLWYANLQDAGLARANLQEADLVCADLQEACLMGANLQGASLGLANLQHAELADANLQAANLDGASLQETGLGGADFQGADLWDADFQEANLLNANLRQANLGGTKLQGAYLMGANFQGASLNDCPLEKVDFFGAKSLEGAYFYNAFLDDTRLKREQLGEAVGEELERKYDEAKEAYLALKSNFAEIGRYDDAAWAYRKERRMEKLEALQKAKLAWKERAWKGVVPHCAKVAVDQLVELVCDYGESVGRVLVSLVVVYALFTLTYGLTWSVIRVRAVPAATIREPTRNLVDLLRFSLGAMTTMDVASLEPRNGLVELVAGVEALLGIFLAGLLGFVAGNRIRRS